MNQFALAGKVIVDNVVWASSNHPDFISCNLPVFVPSLPAFNARIVMQAHLHRLPRKYSFSLLLGSTPVLRLDIGPGRVHSNFATGQIVRGSHWHVWPVADAVPDDRDLVHWQWFEDFCRRACIDFQGDYEPPPFAAEQMVML
jgi:hypothetical protein